MSDSRLAEIFPIGSRVRLKFAPVGEPGTVILHRRNKVVVDWSDLEAVFSYPPDSLLRVNGEQP